MTTVQQWLQAADREPWTAWKSALTSWLVGPILAGQPYNYQGEFDLHEMLGGVFEQAFIPFRTEVTLRRGARIDFTVGRLGIEVKTGGSLLAVYDQLAGYTRTGAVDGLLLLSTCAEHVELADAAGYAVPVAVVHLDGRRLPGGVRQHRHRAR